MHDLNTIQKINADRVKQSVLKKSKGTKKSAKKAKR